MIAWVRRLLAPPALEDEEAARHARLLNVILWALLALAVASGTVTVLANLRDPGEIVVGLFLSGLLVLPVAGGQWLLRSGRVQAASGLLVVLLYVGFVLVTVDAGGVAGPVFAVFVLLVIVAGLLLRRSLVIGVVGICILTGLAFAYAEAVAGWIRPQRVDPVLAWVTYSLIMIFATVLLYLANSSVSEALERARGYAEELESQQRQIEGAAGTYTRILERRNHQVRAVGSIARDLSSMEDGELLVARAVQLMGEQLGLYHVAIYMLDESGQHVVLKATNSAEGKLLLARGHKLSVGSASPVGHVASGLVSHATSGPEHMSLSQRAELPETRAELALPLRVGDETIGVLDLHSSQADAFGAEDVVTFQILADQTAMAIRNAQTQQRIQERLEAERRAYADVAGEGWLRLLRDRGGMAVVRNAQGISMVGDLARSPEMDEAARSGETRRGDGETGGLAVPIVARDQVIGVIRARRSQGHGDWTRQEIALLEALRDQLGEALESARLYEDVQRREAQERIVGQITGRVRETLDLETVLQTAVREMRETLNMAEVEVYLDAGQAEETVGSDVT